jgi:hypothetical protein
MLHTCVGEKHEDDSGIVLEMLASKIHGILHALPWEVVHAVMVDDLREGPRVGSGQSALPQLNEELAHERLYTNQRYKWHVSVLKFL